jgi:hypothetical protein
MFCDQCFCTIRREDVNCPRCGIILNKQEVSSLLKQWSQLSKTPYFQELGQIKAGEDAENWLQNLVENHINYRGTYTFASKRVSYNISKVRKEIDLIVVTASKIHIIEAKNWVGSLYGYGNEWVHNKRDGSQKAYPNLVAYNNDKKQILLNYLKDNGIIVPEHQVCQKIIFLNRNLRLDWAIANNPDVITLAKLGSYLGQQKRATVSQNIVCGVIEYCLSQENAQLVVEGLFGRVTQEKFHQTVSLIDQLPTWDKVMLNGTRILKGDLLGLQLGNRYLRKKDIERESQINVSWSRNRLIGLIKVLIKYDSLGSIKLPNQKPIALSTKDYVHFHIVGQPAPNCVPLMHVDKIITG